MPALGEQFREAREARNLSLSDVAEQIRIRSVYLAAIENENWPAIGAPIYVRGFLRTYARFLGLSPEEAVGEFNAATAEPAESYDSESYASPPRFGVASEAAQERRSLSPLIWIGGIIAVALIAYVIYGALSLERRNAAPAGKQSVATLPVVSGSAEPGSPAPGGSANPSSSASLAANAGRTVGAMGPHTLVLVLKAPSWLRVTIDGSTQFEGVAKTGVVQTYRGKTATLRIGNAGGVEVTVDGKALGALGSSGDVIDRKFIL